MKFKNSPEVIPQHVSALIEKARQVILGKEHEVKLALAALLARGHLLIEDIPGVGKTTFVTCLSRLLGLQMSRIQFTNDLLPADIIGTNIFDQKKGEFQFHPGPIFAEIVLGDELNRASPKAQSAFLQAMEERKITLDGKTIDLPKSFFIIATQNPHTQVGTYPLPESQLDRFMMRLSLGYPDAESEMQLLLSNPRAKLEELQPVMAHKDLHELQSRVEEVHVSPALVRYVYDLLSFSRTRGHGLSPRAGQQLIQAARAWAFISGRDLVLPDDVQEVAFPVFEHRLAAQTLRTGEIIKAVPIP